jgi:hypothetical protein
MEDFERGHLDFHPQKPDKVILEIFDFFIKIFFEIYCFVKIVNIFAIKIITLLLFQQSTQARFLIFVIC